MGHRYHPINHIDHRISTRRASGAIAMQAVEGYLWFEIEEEGLAVHQG